MGGIRAEGGLGREGQRAAVEVGEFEVRSAGQDGFGDVEFGHADPKILVDGRETNVVQIKGGRIMGSDPFMVGLQPKGLCRYQVYLIPNTRINSWFSIST